MMKVLIIDDSESKIRTISAALRCESSIPYECVISQNFADATVKLSQQEFDLIIIDLLLPFTMGGSPKPVGQELLGVLKQGHVNRKSQVVALTQFPTLVEEQRENFNKAGVVILSYEEGREEWRTALISIADRVRAARQLDFVLICALDKEREAFAKTRADGFKREVALGLDLEFMRIGEYQGACVLLAGTGLVHASITTSRAIELFQPKVLAISGICGGFKGHVQLGQILIANPAWEYQTGKWSGNGFQIEPYQVALNEPTRLTMKEVCGRSTLWDELEGELICARPTKRTKPDIVPFASGSAVLASAEKLAEIELQHRKVAGLDMEMYGVYQAARLSSVSPKHFFGAKAVVDLADEDKDDSLHEYGCVVSARFSVLAASALLRTCHM